MTPALIVVSGSPGSGKTTFAHLLAKEIHCPALCRDELKEGYLNTSGASHQDAGPEVNKHIYGLFFQTITLLLENGITLVAEAAFQHKLWFPKLEPLLALARVKVLVCSASPETARARFTQRGLADPSRERFHGDQAGAVPFEGYIPPSLPVPTLEVDTSDGYRPSLEQVAAFVCG